MSLRSRASRFSSKGADRKSDLGTDDEVKRVPCRVLFVGNSHTYQPKELGGVPNAVARLASAACGVSVSVDSVTMGGADLIDLLGAFEEKLKSRASTEMWDTFVLQVGRGADEQARHAITEVLAYQYAPLLLERQPTCTVVLYQTWSGPQPEPSESSILWQTLHTYRATLTAAGIQHVCLAPAGQAFLRVRAAPGIDNHIYPALWKDDMGHGSALAGVLVAMVILLCLGMCSANDERKRRLGQILEAMLPAAWRTASRGFTGATDFGQKGWREESKGAPAAVMGLVQDEEDDLPINRYPPGLRTERHDLGHGFGDVLIQACVEALDSEYPGSNVDAPVDDSTTHSDAPRTQQVQDAQKVRRWQKK
eukprot:TRINITY_DN30650_c0_g1_i1.p1 TRINITY_DN30650_c0_g1~~TRINITY_DN30650_c0_g1_i1.p1  ORF type:complete len:365 (+),score=38.94 TRINITY_DN30650_c0_g1_i1:51-1145(+)